MGPGAGMTRFECIDWYDTPRYYDIVFDAGTAVECDFLLAALLFGSRLTAIDSPVAPPLHFRR